MTDYSLLTTVFSSKIRIKILKCLFNNPLALSEITNDISNISNSEISRHLSKLSEFGLIRKESPTSRKYELSFFGKTLHKLIEPISFVSSRSSYFKQITLEDLPLYLTRNIDFLDKSKIISGTGNVINAMKVFTEETQSSIFIMIDSAFPFDNPRPLHQKFIIPKDITQNKEKEREVKESTITFEARTLPHTPIAIGLRDYSKKSQSGMILLPKGGENHPNYDTAFVVTDEDGLWYLKQIWDYFWEEAEILEH